MAGKVDKIGQHKKAILEALEKSLGVVSSACKIAGISRQTFYSYLKDDPDFEAAVNDVENIALDYAESQLHKRIGSGDTTAIIFYLKTKGRRRGYDQSLSIDHTTGGQPFQVTPIHFYEPEEE